MLQTDTKAIKTNHLSLSEFCFQILLTYIHFLYISYTQVAGTEVTANRMISDCFSQYANHQTTNKPGTEGLGKKPG